MVLGLRFSGLKVRFSGFMVLGFRFSGFSVVRFRVRNSRRQRPVELLPDHLASVPPRQCASH